MLKRKAEEIFSYLYRVLLFPFRKWGIETSTKSICRQGSYWNKGTVFAGRNQLGKGAYLSHTELGYGSYVGTGTRLINTKVGKYTSIGSGVSCAFGLHPTDTFVSTHPAFYSKKAMGFSYVKEDKFREEGWTNEEQGIQLEIGNDVWIGNNVVLCEGVHIADGVILAAGAVVVSDCEAYGIYGGVPAKKIKSRFSEEQVQRLLEDPWWEKPESRIREMAEDFEDIEKFLQ